VQNNFFTLVTALREEWGSKFSRFFIVKYPRSFMMVVTLPEIPGEE
jgi:hypothetical protein